MSINYSEPYCDNQYMYRHVIVKRRPTKHLLTESEWRAVGIQMSRGWVHYQLFPLVPAMYLFRRPLPLDHKSKCTFMKDIDTILNTQI